MSSIIPVFPMSHAGEGNVMTQDELKKATAEAALERILPHLEDDMIIGIGTGSTANFFIDAPGRA